MLWSLLITLGFSLLLSLLRVSAASSSTLNITSYTLPRLNVGDLGSGLYYVNASFGTPAQRQRLLIDISKAYSWVISGASDLQCNQLNSGCVGSGLYYPAESTSSVNVFGDTNEQFNILFVDGTTINGTIFMDNWNFTDMESVKVRSLNRSLTYMPVNSDVVLTNASLTLKNTSFINVDSKGQENGVLGLANGVQPLNDHILYSTMNSPLPVLQKLREANLINSISYSLWLGNRTYPHHIENDTAPPTNSYAGKLLFGGVDPSLYVGSFYQFKMIPYVDSTSNISTSGFPIIPMGPVYMSAKNGRKLNMTSEEYLEPVLLDSSLQGIYLPVPAIIQIAIQLGATYVPSLDGWLVPCDIATTGAHLDFTFDGMPIQVPIRDLLARTIDSTTSTEMHFADGSTACSLKLSSNDNIGFNVLGTAFLKNAYVAVNMEGSLVGLAKARNVTKAGMNVTTTINMNEPVSTQYVTTMSVKMMSSGYIPYATHRSEGSGTNLSIYVTSTATGIPAQFTAVVYSNGLISGIGRSFFDTSRQTSTTRKSTSPYSFFSLNGSGLESFANGTATTPINAGRKRLVPKFIPYQDRRIHLSSIDPLSWLAISTVAVIVAITAWL